MNDILAAEMEEALYGMDEHEERKEGFVVNDDNKADWVLRKIKQNADKMEEIQELYEAQSMRLTAWKSEQLDRLTKDKENLEMLLAPYVESKLNGGKKKSFVLPNGKCGFRSIPAKIEKDENMLLEFVKTVSPGNIKVKESVNWASFKKGLTVDGNKMIVTDTGEVVPGVTVTEQPDKFYTEV